VWISRDDSGYGMLEYGLVIALVAIIGVAALLFLGTGSNSSLSRSANSLPAGQPAVWTPP
jgi:Flp pilus assembly pilin Flp